jgi:mannose/fructose/N-acetylgalactosamine-specific phosphotransferase system component IIC
MYVATAWYFALLLMTAGLAKLFYPSATESHIESVSQNAAGVTELALAVVLTQLWLNTIVPTLALGLLLVVFLSVRLQKLRTHKPCGCFGWKGIAAAQASDVITAIYWLALWAIMLISAPGFEALSTQLRLFNMLASITGIAFIGAAVAMVANRKSSAERMALTHATDGTRSSIYALRDRI